MPRTADQPMPSRARGARLACAALAAALAMPTIAAAKPKQAEQRGAAASSQRAAAPQRGAGPTTVRVVPSEEAEEERPLDEEVRLLEGRIGDLRERIFGTKARLASLQELVTGEDVAGGARARIRHRNEMGAAFVLESATFQVDGAPVFVETNVAGELERKADLDVFAGRLTPGRHVLGVRLVYRHAVEGGAAKLLDVQGSFGFDVEAGKLTVVDSTGHEKKDARVEERPALRWNVAVETDRAAAPAEGGRR